MDKLTGNNILSVILAKINGLIDVLNRLATVATSGSYNDLINKPSKLSQFENDGNYGTNTAIQAVANSIPTLTSQLNNNSGYITNEQLQSSIPTKTSQLNNNSGYITNEQLQSSINAVYNAIPTKTSQLTNDSGFTTSGGSTTSNGEGGI